MESLESVPAEGLVTVMMARSSRPSKNLVSGGKMNQLRAGVTSTIDVHANGKVSEPNKAIAMRCAPTSSACAYGDHQSQQRG